MPLLMPVCYLLKFLMHCDEVANRIPRLLHTCYQIPHSKWPGKIVIRDRDLNLIFPRIFVRLVSVDATGETAASKADRKECLGAQTQGPRRTAVANESLNDPLGRHVVHRSPILRKAVHERSFSQEGDSSPKLKSQQPFMPGQSHTAFSPATPKPNSLLWSRCEKAGRSLFTIKSVG